MDFISVQNYARFSPKKVREVVYMIKKMKPVKAVDYLPFASRVASETLQKTIKAAIAQAKEKGVDEKDLLFKEIQITDGPRIKRGIAVSRGRWHPIVKRMSHIRIVLTSTPPKIEKLMPAKAQKTKPEVTKKKSVKKLTGKGKK